MAKRFVGRAFGWAPGKLHLVFLRNTEAVASGPPSVVYSRHTMLNLDG